MNRLSRTALWAGAAVAVPMAVNAYIRTRAGRLGEQLPGDVGYYDWIHGRVGFYRMGVGSPLLLVHHPMLGGNAGEWRHVFPDLAMRHTVYAIDLLGFGISDRPNISYSGAMYAELLHDFLEDVIGAPADAIGSGLGATYLVHVAVRRPERLGRLVLVNPVSAVSAPPAGLDTAARVMLRAPVLGTSLYYALATHDTIEQDLRERRYFDPTAVTPEMVDAVYQSAHQPGAGYPMAAAWTGKLDLPLRPAFSALEQPTLMVWGRHAADTPVREAADLQYRQPHARLVVMDRCAMLPHDERAGEFLSVVRDFLHGAEASEQAA